ncbi:hypothetical protein D3C85_1941300 [compost metagenome]
MWHRYAQQSERAGQVGTYHVLPVFVTEQAYRAGPDNPGIQDQSIDGTKLFDCDLNQLVEVRY